MSALISAPLITTVTALSWSARNTAACPAELPPPTTTTGSPAISRVSTSVAA